MLTGIRAGLSFLSRSENVVVGVLMADLLQRNFVLAPSVLFVVVRASGWVLNAVDGFWNLGEMCRIHLLDRK
jgi:hypothetical protein